MMLTGKTYKELAVVVQKMLENDGDAYCPPAVTLAKALPKSTVASPEHIDALARMWTRTSPIVAGDSVALYLASRGIGVSRRLANLRINRGRWPAGDAGTGAAQLPGARWRRRCASCTAPTCRPTESVSAS